MDNSDKFTFGSTTNKYGTTTATRFADNDKVNTAHVGTIQKMGAKIWVAVPSRGVYDGGVTFKTKHQAQTWLIDKAVEMGYL